MQPQKAHHETVGSYLFQGLNLKTILFALFAATTTYYVQQGHQNDRISVTEEKSFATNHRIDELERIYEAKFATQLATLQALRESTLRKDTYDRDQQRESKQFEAIDQRFLTLDGVLMQLGLRHPH